MKVLVYGATQQAQFRDEPAPRPGVGEALVGIEAAGGRACRGVTTQRELGFDQATPCYLALMRPV